jgi:hypothetical protein
VRLRGFRVRSLDPAPADPGDEFLAELIEAAGAGSISLDDFARSLT